MEHPKIITLLDNAPNRLFKLIIKNWIKMNDQSRGVYNDQSRGVYNVISNIRFKNAMLKSSLCDYNNAYILVKGRTTITRGLKE